MTHEGTYIKFVEGPKSKSGKTQTWWIVQKQKDLHLGWVGWWGSWRRYAFYPKPNTVFEEVCLRDITAFITERTRAHREALKIARLGKKAVTENIAKGGTIALALEHLFPPRKKK